ncbi:hypothetical protein H312_03277 [Anncaliia algerae PRA339]|uniref:Uncharacterized protein n=1 Tax=Anncaliia algerae PRA339 TaxID=1288291 RepID=A0A059EX52_9MICR|nr:hypothetical protein H312_03277 [Anncaliia algerae PRA339]
MAIFLYLARIFSSIEVIDKWAEDYNNYNPLVYSKGYFFLKAYCSMLNYAYYKIMESNLSLDLDINPTIHSVIQTLAQEYGEKDLKPLINHLTTILRCNYYRKYLFQNNILTEERIKNVKKIIEMALEKYKLYLLNNVFLKNLLIELGKDLEIIYYENRDEFPSCLKLTNYIFDLGILCIEENFAERMIDFDHETFLEKCLEEYSDNTKVNN